MSESSLFGDFSNNLSMIKPIFLIFLGIAVGLVGYSSVYAEDLPLSIDAQTNKNFYNYGESVGISGKIKNYDADTHSGNALVYQIFNPVGEMVALCQTDPGQFGAFSFNFIARGDLFLSDGAYSI